MADPMKPCPFCAGTDIRITCHPMAGDGMHRGEDVYSMCCYTCGATFPNRYRRELLVEAWNRRSTASVAICRDGRDFVMELAMTMGVVDPTADSSTSIPVSELMPRMLERAREDRDRWHRGALETFTDAATTAGLETLVGPTLCPHGVPGAAWCQICTPYERPVPQGGA